MITIHARVKTIPARFIPAPGCFKEITVVTLAVILAAGMPACKTGKSGQTEKADRTAMTGKYRKSGPDTERAGQLALSDQLEESLSEYILERWYPLVTDTVNGGYHSTYSRDWKQVEEASERALVQQARHVWATSMIYENYPEKREYLEYAAGGFRFLRDAMWDKESGGFYAYCIPEGSPVERSITEKKIYGQAFTLYGLSRYYRVSNDPEALELAQMEFLWMEQHAHDGKYGGYFEALMRDGTPEPARVQGEGTGGFSDAGLKDYNSSIHLMEALTELYGIWPDSLVRARLEEMFYLIRDTFVHPDGYLLLYFEPDWTHVSGAPATEGAPEAGWFLNHFTYGHDVETAYLLLETAHALGLGEDEKTRHLAKQLVDHSLASGWDTLSGGFFDAGIAGEEGITIVNTHKSWWGQVEGMNALLLMHTLYPDDPLDYYGKFLKSWEHIDTYLIDKTYGGWYNNALDTWPENIDQPKSHIWKTTYHNARGMVNCIHMLRESSP
jgi:mannobiose 2-epimerase